MLEFGYDDCGIHSYMKHLSAIVKSDSMRFKIIKWTYYINFLALTVNYWLKYLKIVRKPFTAIPSHPNRMPIFTVLVL